VIVLSPGKTNNPASQSDNYYMSDQQQDQNLCGVIFPAREAVSQGQKTVRETASSKTHMLTLTFHLSSCSQYATNGKTLNICKFTDCSLCVSTDHIHTFHSVQKSLFTQTKSKTYDAETIYHAFFSEEPIQNYDA
jgi:hypothetical protein